jgi:hypothetical protein
MPSLQAGRASGLSFVMGPHANYLYNAFFGQDLINKSMLDVDAAGIGAR